MKSREIAALAATVLAACVYPAASRAEPEPASCRTVRFADIGWTDITSTTALASAVFEARVYTLTAPDFLARCPNAGRLVSNLRFSTQLESELMQAVMNKTRPADAARTYLKKNPQALEPWLAGVNTFDGRDGLPAVKAYLGL